MSKLLSSVSLLLVAVFLLSSCSKNNLAQKTEVDDMYFTSQDRLALVASTKTFDENFVEDYEKPLSEEQADEYAEVNYSSKTVNPEYIAKYTTEEVAADEQTADSEYFDENYNQTTAKSSQTRTYDPRYNNSPYGWSSSAYNPYSVWNNDPWYNPYRYQFGYGYPSSSFLSLSFYTGYSYGSSWYRNPYRRYNPFNDYSNFWYSNPYYFSGYYPTSYYGYAGVYCPPGYAGYSGSSYYGNPGYYNSDNVVSVINGRTITRGPRVARGATLPENSRRGDYRDGRSDDIRITDDGTVAVNENSRTSNSRNNYYRRTRSTGSEVTSTRGYQRSSTRNSSVASNTSSRRGSSSGYSRSSQSSYRTQNRSSNNTGARYSTGSSSRSSYSRSSSFRTSSGNRSGSSIRSGSTGSSGRSTISTGSRSSSSGSSSRSSGSSRSSSSGSKRGGN